MQLRIVSLMLLGLGIAGAACATLTEDATPESPVASRLAQTTTTATAVPTTTPGPELTVQSSTTRPAETSTAMVATTSLDEDVAGPTPNSEWSVVGVRFYDVLNIRDLPGTESSVVHTLVPTADGVRVTGNAVLMSDTIWWEVNEPTAGWVAATYLAAKGETVDITSAVAEANNGVSPAAATIRSLAESVATILGADSINEVGRASDGDRHGEIAIDVFFPNDDSIRGNRLLIVGQRDGPDRDFGLYSVEATSLCWRGVDPAGLCI